MNVYSISELLLWMSISMPWALYFVCEVLFTVLQFRLGIGSIHILRIRWSLLKLVLSDTQKFKSTEQISVRNKAWKYVCCHYWGRFQLHKHVWPLHRLGFSHPVSNFHVRKITDSNSIIRVQMQKFKVQSCKGSKWRLFLWLNNHIHPSDCDHYGT